MFHHKNNSRLNKILDLMKILKFYILYIKSQLTNIPVPVMSIGLKFFALNGKPLGNCS